MDVQVTVSRKNLDMHFLGTNALGKTVAMDGSTSETSQGTSPMELILMAIGGCSGIDVQHILKKQRQHAESLDIVVNGQRVQHEDFKEYTSIDVLFKVTGDVDPEKLQRAVKLSMEKYCSVSKLVEQTCPVNSTIELNGTLIA